MNSYFKLYSPGSRVRAKREIDILYRDRSVGAKAEFTGDRYRFTLPPELDTKMIYGDLEASFKLAPAADFVPAPVALVLSDRYK
jgi:hypothetical protein